MQRDKIVIYIAEVPNLEHTTLRHRHTNPVRGLKEGEMKRLLQTFFRAAMIVILVLFKLKEADLSSIGTSPNLSILQEVYFGSDNRGVGVVSKDSKRAVVNRN